MVDQQYKCGECGAKCPYAPGIGPYCPTDDCPIGDGPGLIKISDDGEGGATGSGYSIDELTQERRQKKYRERLDEDGEDR